MNVISVERVSKRFKLYKRSHFTLKEAIINTAFFRTSRKEYFEALKDISLTVAQGGTLGIVGRNGSGKSTLLKTIAGIYRPDSGSIKINGRIALLNLGVGFHPELTGRENIRINALVMGLTPKQIREKFDEIVSFAEIEQFVDAPVRTYSSGMYLRLAFSIAINVDPDILLLDEVMAVGDEQFAEKCKIRMNEFKLNGKTILLVTHDPKAVVEWCDRAILLEHGCLKAMGHPKKIIDIYHAHSDQHSLVQPEEEITVFA
ncbi:MAG: ABC transporter ATP-binding protein [Pyrinomonadaceae bacterium]